MPMFNSRIDYSHVIANQAQLDWMVRRWPYYSVSWRIGYVQLLAGDYLNQMERELGSRFMEGYVRPPLQRWWEPEIAALPDDRHAD